MIINRIASHVIPAKEDNYHTVLLDTIYHILIYVFTGVEKINILLVFICTTGGGGGGIEFIVLW